MRRLAPALMLVAATARAGGLVVEDGSPRAIGRAGVGTASDDGAGALLVNPAGLARRDTTRIQIGAAFADDALDWRAASGDAPVARDQSASSAMPALAIEGALGCWIVGAGVQTAAASARTFASPVDFPPDQLANRFEYRYAGIASTLRRDTASVAAAHRFGDAVALGVSVGLSRVALDEARSVWADPVEGRAVDPNHDVAIAMSASGLSPSATAGMLIAPPDTRVELAASISWQRATDLEGTFAAVGPRPGSVAPGLAVDVSSPSARVELHQPVTARAGVRWLGQHWIGEVDGDVWIFSHAAESATWRLSGLDVVDTASGAAVSPASLASRVSAQTYGAVRGAIDVEVIAGYLWLTGGYAYATAGTATSRLSPTFGDLGGHTGALGIEVSAGGFTVSFGWARTWSIAHAAPTTAWQHDNPYGAGDSAVPTGTYDGSRDLIGISVDGELGNAAR